MKLHNKEKHSVITYFKATNLVLSMETVETPHLLSVKEWSNDKGTAFCEVGVQRAACKLYVKYRQLVGLPVCRLASREGKPTTKLNVS
jgi:hypothetical protein